MVNKERIIYFKWFHSSVFGRFSFKNVLKKFYNEFISHMHEFKFSFFLDFEKMIKKRINRNTLHFFRVLFSSKFLEFFTGKKKEGKTQSHLVQNFPNKTKKKQKTFFPGVQYVDFIGIESFLPKIQEFIEWPLKHWDIYQKLNLLSSRNILFSGVCGIGKAYLAHAIAGELKLPLFFFSAESFLENENNEKKFKKILFKAERKSPSIVFIDKIDSLFSQHQNFQKEGEKKTLNQLVKNLEKLNKKKKKVFVIASTDQNSLINEALRRQGRFNKEIKLTSPNYPSRCKLINHFISGVFFQTYIETKDLALKTKGLSPRDLSELVKSSATIALSKKGARFLKGKYRAKKGIGSFFNVTHLDFQRAFSLVLSKTFRYGLKSFSNKSWEDIGGMEEIRKILSKYIIQPIKKLSWDLEEKNQFGILLFGPPGCGKTLISQALAYESGASLISVKGPEILDKFLGESEKAIRNLFEKARSCSPSIIFFDEFDSIATKRSSNGNSSSQGATDRVVNQLLTEMDGTEQNNLVYLIAATNRPDMIDRALLRPGRIDKLVFIPLPDKKEKISILKTISKKLVVLPYLNFSVLLKNYSIPLSGADIVSFSKEAWFISKEKMITYYELKNSGKGLSLGFHLHPGFEDFSKGASIVLMDSFFKRKSFEYNRKFYCKLKKPFR